MDIYYIFKCPECGGLQVDTDPDSPLAICIHGQGRGKPQRVINRERIEVIPKRDQLQGEMTYTINICPECGAQELPSPVPGLLAETIHTEECSGPDNVTIEVVPRSEVPRGDGQ